jgi:hypothetical protein
LVNKLRASTADIRSTSLMFLPRSWYASTSAVNRSPLQSSQTEATSAIIASSV